MTDREMFEASFKRPREYFTLSVHQQWEIDRELGILDWKGTGLTPEDKKRYVEHYYAATIPRKRSRP